MNIYTKWIISGVVISIIAIIASGEYYLLIAIPAALLSALLLAWHIGMIGKKSKKYKGRIGDW